jgi:lauroyl/myristoyl acyltransferase
MVAFLLLSLYGRVIALLPSWCSSLLCMLLARVALLTSLRLRVERGMGQFPWTRDYDVEDLARKHIRFLVNVFHNILYIRYHPWPRNRVAEKVRYENESYLKEALMGKRGVILLSLHLGNFFWSIADLSATYPINLVVRVEKNPYWEAFAKKMREKWQIKAIYSEGAAMKIKNKLKKGEIVVFVIDQYIFPFFYGPDHPLRQILPRLVQISSAPVIPFYTLDDNSHIIVRFLPPLKEVSPAVLEDMIMQGVKERPHLWFWWRRLGKVNKSLHQA